MGEIIDQIIYEPFLRKIIAAVIGVILILIIKSVIKSRLGKHIKDRSNSYRTEKVVGITGYLLIVVFIMVIFSETFGGMTVFLGVAGAGMAFALQDIIASVAGWVVIISSAVYKTGDRILIGAIKGDVIDVGILRTTIMEMGDWVNGDLYNGRIVRISNSFVFKGPVFNYSSNFPFLWDEIKIPVKYGSDYQIARKIIHDAADKIVGEYSEEAKIYWERMVNKFLIEDAAVKPMVFMAANDNWVEFTLRYVVNYRSRVTIKDHLFSEILEKIEVDSTPVNLASATFELVQMPQVDVKLRENRPYTDGEQL